MVPALLNLWGIKSRFIFFWGWSVVGRIVSFRKNQILIVSALLLSIFNGCSRTGISSSASKMAFLVNAGGTINPASSVATVGNTPSTQAALSYSSSFTDCKQGANMFCSWESDPGWGARSLSEDVVLTSVTLDVTGIKKGTTVETCMGIYRDVDPKYPHVIAGYSEIMCWHVMLQAVSKDWHTTVDLSNTPLYLPKNTHLGCGANYGAIAGDSLSAADAALANFNCNVQYKSYQPNDPRYRVLRLPYNDQAANSDGSLATSYYIGSTMAPIHVKAVALFESFGGDSRPGNTTNACLKWIRQGGAEVQQSCFPDLSVAAAANFETPGLQKMDWMIPNNELLTATTQQSRTNTDAAFYAIVEIPPAITPSPENIVRDYGNVPAEFLKTFCTNDLQNLTHSYYCNDQSSCSDQTKINQCIALFPAASCLASGSCTSSTSSPTPTPSSTPAPTPTPAQTSTPTPAPAVSCSFNGQSVLSGNTVTAFQASSVAYGSSCVSQVRTCTNGTLSGSYSNSSCSVAAAPVTPVTPVSPSATLQNSCWMNSGVQYVAGQGVKSYGGQYTLIVQNDGNVVLYGPSGALWSTRTDGQSISLLAMQGDGNLVLYSLLGQALWSSHTEGNPGAKLAVQDDGNLVIYSSSGKALWVR